MGNGAVFRYLPRHTPAHAKEGQGTSDGFCRKALTRLAVAVQVGTVDVGGMMRRFLLRTFFVWSSATGALLGLFVPRAFAADEFNTQMSGILDQVWPAAATVLWNFRGIFVFFLSVLLAFALGAWLRSLAPGSKE